jgi:hypothetical protein
MSNHIRKMIFELSPKDRAGLFMKLAHPARIARRRNSKQRVATRGQPVIENWAKFGEGPHRKNRNQPPPTRQHANDFNPGKVAFHPTAIGRARMHRVGHLDTRVRRDTLQDFRIVVIQPLNSMIAIQGLDARPHPAAKIAVAVRVDFDCFRLVHRLYQECKGTPLSNDYYSDIKNDTIGLPAEQ